MLQAGMLLAQARTAFLQPDIAAVQVGALGILAPSAVIPGLANLLAAFDLAHRPEAVPFDLPLAFWNSFRFSWAFAVAAQLRLLHQWLHSGRSPLKVSIAQCIVKGPLTWLASAHVGGHAAPGQQIIPLEP